MERPRGGRREAVVIVDQEVTATLVEIVEQHAAFTLRQMKENLQLLLPRFATISVSTIERTLDGQVI